MFKLRILFVYNKLESRVVPQTIPQGRQKFVFGCSQIIDWSSSSTYSHRVIWKFSYENLPSIFFLVQSTVTNDRDCRLQFDWSTGNLFLPETQRENHNVRDFRVSFIVRGGGFNERERESNLGGKLGRKPSGSAEFPPVHCSIRQPLPGLFPISSHSVRKKQNQRKYLENKIFFPTPARTSSGDLQTTPKGAIETSREITRNGLCLSNRSSCMLWPVYPVGKSCIKIK